jgi:outer membrane protein assembly factor BamB
MSILAPPVRNREFFYVSGTDRRVHVFRAKDMVRIFKIAADNQSLITSVVADDNQIVLGTAAGNLVAVAPDAAKKQWQFDATGAIAGPVIADGSSVFFASKDTHVYRIGATGKMVWRYQMEAILDREPRVTAAVVYQYATGRGLTAIDKRSGRALWSLPEGIDLLAEAGAKAYVITQLKTLAVMDNMTGKQLYSVNFSPVTKYAANVADDNIYVADDGGHVACLRPVP